MGRRDADALARQYLALTPAERSQDDRDRCLSTPEIVLAICGALRESCDLDPLSVEQESTAIYRRISDPKCVIGLFDERDYFLGETALLAGSACRQLGKREEAFLWLDRAEAGFRHTLNPAPGLANVSYARLALRFETGRYRDVLELLPSLTSSFAKLGMASEAAKCNLLLAMTFKQTGENHKAIEILTDLCREASLEAKVFLKARILAELGDLLQLEGNLERAVLAFKQALSLLEGQHLSLAEADLKLYVGGVYKAQGSLEDAALAFRAAQRDYSTLNMRAQAAYAHLVIAETLLRMDRDREAEWEIRTALPTIDEVGMVPEGYAALALLRESLQKRRPDLSALQRLQGHLQNLS